MGDFLVYDAWKGARIHQEIQPVAVADRPLHNDQVPW